MDSRMYYLAGYLSALPEFHNRHPETLLDLAANILKALQELVRDEVEEPPWSLEKLEEIKRNERNEQDER